MKKIVALMLALAMALAMGAVAFADDPEYTKGEAPANMSAEAAITFTVDKIVEAAGTGASLPAQTFAATSVGSAAVTYVKYNDGMTEEIETGAAITAGVPTLSITGAGAAVAEGGTTGKFTFSTDKAFPQTGVYTYFFKETDGNIAGTVYDFDEGSTSYSEDGKVFGVRITVENGKDANAGHLMVGGISVRPAYKDGTVYAIDYSKEKLGDITNYYNAGSLEISKTVTGNLGDTQKDWNFTVVFTSPTAGNAQDVVKSIITYTTTNTDGTVTATNATVADNKITATGDGWTTSTVTFTLKSGENIKFENIPAGTTYTVNEAEAGQDGYTTTIAGSDEQNTVTKTAEFKDLTAAPAGDQATGTITVTAERDDQDVPTFTNDDDVVAYTNDKSVDVDTGITLESVPYIMIMMIAMAGAAMMIARKRREEV